MKRILLLTMIVCLICTSGLAMSIQELPIVNAPEGAEEIVQLTQNFLGLEIPQEAVWKDMRAWLNDESQNDHYYLCSFVSEQKQQKIDLFVQWFTSGRISISIWDRRQLDGSALPESDAKDLDHAGKQE